MNHMSGRSSLLVLVTALASTLALPLTARAHIPEPATWQPLPIQLRVLRPGELLDLAPVGTPLLVRARQLPDATRAPYGISAGKAGFLGAMIERLRSRDSAVRAVNVVAVFGSDRAANAQLATWTSGDRLRPSPTGLNIAFADGKVAYLVRVSWHARALGRVLSAEVLADMTAYYDRVHGHPVG
jgi:hypothetical protein